jgi:3-hydroxyisobutyrate dehydrogenase-like beta-hydroxyacid dehydrogenase
MEELVEHGATATASPAEAASRAEFVITMLPADEHIRAAVLGPDGVASGIGRGSILIEMSTASPATARELEAALAQADAYVVDAPVGRGHRQRSTELCSSSHPVSVRQSTGAQRSSTP